MAKLVLKEVSYKNFLSTGNSPTIIKINEHKTTLMCGNKGSGKTTLNDAICFTWFNKALRKINKSQLVNTINNGNTETSTTFSIGDNEYKVTRGIKPNKLEILVNGAELDLASGTEPQEWLEELIGFSFKTMKHVILLGNASYTPFMQMDAKERRELVEDLRDLDVFSAMAKLAKAELDKLNKTFVSVNSDAAVMKNKIVMLEQFIKESENDTTDRKSAINDDINQQQATIASKRTERASLVEDGKTLSSTLLIAPESFGTDLAALKNDRDAAVQKKKRLEVSINDFNKLTVCPTCKQEVGEDHKHGMQDKVNDSITKLSSGISLIQVDIDAKQIEYDHFTSTNLVINNELALLRASIKDIDVEIKTATSFIEKYQSMLSDIDKSVEGIDTRKSELSTTTLSFAAKSTELTILTDDISIIQECQKHLKDDGIKSSLIDAFIPIFNSLVNKYLEMMDFYVRFELDKEFNEIIKSRHRDVFSYYSFSEGEKQTIDIALLFAWRELTMLSGNALTNVIVLDEVFDSSLDIDTTSLVIDILSNMGEDTNIIVISHKPIDAFDGFDRTIAFEKQKNFSVMKEIT